MLLKTCMRACLPTIVIACLGAGSALADASVTVDVKGYNDFFDRCDLDFATKAPGGGEATVYYRILAGAKGGAVCEKAPYSSGCRSSDDLEYTCEDVSAVDVLHVQCTSDDGTPTPCGKVKAKAGKDMRAPVSSPPGAAAADGLRILATILGGRNYTGNCALGITYSGPKAIELVEMTYEVPVGGQTDRCTLNMGRTMSTGLSCLGADDYACNAVNKVNITGISCRTADGEADCGKVTIQAAEQGVFVDAR